jgi:hypothetical protein
VELGTGKWIAKILVARTVYEYTLGVNHCWSGVTAAAVRNQTGKFLPSLDWQGFDWLTA